MKILPSLAWVVPLLGPALLAQIPVQPPVNPPSAAVASPMLFAPEQLDQLLGPIALYPDPLIALILPASTNPSDVVLAARYLDAGGDPADADNQPWDDSIRALAHYPEVVKWMDANLAWTKQLGDAFTAQPADVMNAIQRLRARARAAGTLIDSAQQQVVYEGGTIMIVPTQPDVIYVPYYDPAIVYAPPAAYYGYPPNLFFNFSTGFVTGWWLSYGFDWGHHRLWTIHHEDRERFWREHRDPRDRWHVTPGRVGPPREARDWRPHGDSRPQRFAPARPAPAPQPRPELRHDDHPTPPRGAGDRFSPRNDRPTSTPPVAPDQPGRFTGRRTVNPPTPVPGVAPSAPLPTATLPRADSREEARRYDRRSVGPNASAPGVAPMPVNPAPRPTLAAPPPPPSVPQARAFTPQYGSVGVPMPHAYTPPPPVSHAAGSPPHIAPPPHMSAPPPVARAPQPAPQPAPSQPAPPPSGNPDDVRRHER